MRAGDSVRDVFPDGWLLDVGDARRVFVGLAIAAYGVNRRTPVGIGLAALGAALVYRGLTAARSVPDEMCRRSRAVSEEGARGTVFEASIIVDRPADELYQFWRAIENLPKFMHHLDLVMPMSGNRSHWAVTTPRGVSVTWEGELEADDEGHWVAWRATGTAANDYAGRVHFVSRGEHTEVRVQVAMDPHGGLVGRTFATLFRSDPQAVLAADLRRFKQLMEASDAARQEPRAFT